MTPLLNRRIGRRAGIFLYVFAGLLLSAAPSGEKRTVFCLEWNWVAMDANVIAFKFEPSSGQKFILATKSAWIPEREDLAYLCEIFQASLETKSGRYLLETTDDEIVNPSTRFTLLYTSGTEVDPRLLIRRSILDGRLKAYFEVHRGEMPADHIVKIVIGVKNYKMDRESGNFVEDRVLQADYILIRFESGHGKVVGYNTDSLTGLRGVPPTMLGP